MYQDDVIDSKFRSHREYYVDAFRREMARIWAGVEDVAQNPDEVASLCYFRALVAFYDRDQVAIVDRRRLLYAYLTGEFRTKDETDTLNRYRRSLPVQSMVRRVVRNLATAYDEPPKRKFSQDERTDERLATAYRELGLDSNMATVYHKARLCGVVAARPLTVGGRLRFDYMTPDLFRVDVDPEDPTTPTSVTYVRSGRQGTEYVTWTVENMTITDLEGRTVGAPTPNPYGRLPFAFLRLENGPQYFAGGMLELVEEQLGSNKLRFIADVNATFAGSPVWFGINLKSPSLQISADRVLTFDGVTEGEGQLLPPSLEAVNPDGQYAELDEFRRSRERAAALGEGLPASMLSDGSQAPPSGISRVIERSEVIEQRMADVKVLRAFEQDLAELTALVIRHDLGEPVNPALVAVSVDFSEERVFLEPETEYNFDKAKVKDGTLDPVEFYRKWGGLDAELNQVEVLAMVADRRKFARALEAAGASVDQGTGDPTPTPGPAPTAPTDPAPDGGNGGE